MEQPVKPYPMSERVVVSRAVQFDVGDLVGAHGRILSSWAMAPATAQAFGFCGQVYVVQFDNGRERPILHEELQLERAAIEEGRAR